MGWAERAKQKFNHHDAFFLMTYRCEQCGLREQIWNSRDGITPFIVGCSRCDGHMQHVDWNQDKRVLDYQPPPTSRVFINLTLAKAIANRTAFVEEYWDGKYPMSGRWPTKEAAIQELAQHDLDEFKPFTPDLVTAEEWRATRAPE